MSTQDPVEEASGLPLNQRITHSHWKVRSLAYEELTKKFHTAVDTSGSVFKEYANYMKNILSDKHPVSLDKGLEAVKEFFDRYDNADKLVPQCVEYIVDKCLGSARQMTRQRGLDILLLMVEIDKNADSVVNALLEGSKSKTPKVAAASISALNTVLKTFGNKVVPMKLLLQSFLPWFDHNNSEVRSNAQQFTVELCRWVGAPVMTKLIEELRPAQKKELLSAFDELPKETPKAERVLRSQMDQMEEEGDEGGDEEEMDPFNLTGATDVLSKITPEIYAAFGEKKWSERRDALVKINSLLDVPRLASGDYDELFGYIKKSLGEVYVMIVEEAIRSIGLLARGLRSDFTSYARSILPKLFEKFKEKKEKFLQNLHNTLQQMHPHCFMITDIKEEIVQASKSKVPQVKKELLNFLKVVMKNERRQEMAKANNKTTFAEMFISLMNDSDETVRNNSFECFGLLVGLVGEKQLQGYMNQLDKIKLKKIESFIPDKPIGIAGPAKKEEPEPEKKVAKKVVKKVASTKKVASKKVATKKPSTSPPTKKTTTAKVSTTSKTQTPSKSTKSTVSSKVSTSKKTTTVPKTTTKKSSIGIKKEEPAPKKVEEPKKKEESPPPESEEAELEMKEPEKAKEEQSNEMEIEQPAEEPKEEPKEESMVVEQKIEEPQPKPEPQPEPVIPEKDRRFSLELDKLVVSPPEFNEADLDIERTKIPEHLKEPLSSIKKPRHDTENLNQILQKTKGAKEVTTWLAMLSNPDNDLDTIVGILQEICRRFSEEDPILLSFHAEGIIDWIVQHLMNPKASEFHQFKNACFSALYYIFSNDSAIPYISQEIAVNLFRMLIEIMVVEMNRESSDIVKALNNLLVKILLTVERSPIIPALLQLLRESMTSIGGNEELKKQFHDMVTRCIATVIKNLDSRKISIALILREIHLLLEIFPYHSRQIPKYEVAFKTVFILLKEIVKIYGLNIKQYIHLIPNTYPPPEIFHYIKVYIKELSVEPIDENELKDLNSVDPQYYQGFDVKAYLDDRRIKNIQDYPSLDLATTYLERIQMLQRDLGLNVERCDTTTVFTPTFNTSQQLYSSNDDKSQQGPRSSKLIVSELRKRLNSARNPTHQILIPERTDESVTQMTTSMTKEGAEKINLLRERLRQLKS